MNIPAAIREHIQPMPTDFNPPIQTDGKKIWWRGSVNVSQGTAVSRLQLEMGRSAYGGLAADALIREMVWEAHEVARLGHHDLLAVYRVDRHKMRPKLTAPTQQVAPTT